MFINILALILVVCALIITYKTAFVLKKVLHTENPTDEVILKTKLIALGLGILAFVLVLIND